MYWSTNWCPVLQKLYRVRFTYHSSSPTLANRSTRLHIGRPLLSPEKSGTLLPAGGFFRERLGRDGATFVLVLTVFLAVDRITVHLMSSSAIDRRRLNVASQCAEIFPSCAWPLHHSSWLTVFLRPRR